MAAEIDEAESTARKRQQRQQLTKGMEHMRTYVTISDTQASPHSLADQDAYGVPATYEPIRQPASTSRDNPQKRSDPFQFGSRYLEEGDDIFAHNAWDHVEVDPQYADFITQQTLFQRDHQVSDFDKKRFNERPEQWWNRFYSNNQANFFKDRKWLVQEFPVLGEITRADYGPVTVLEIGAGAGNTAFPVLAMNANPQLNLRACDYSKKAIDVIRTAPAYVNQDQAILHADVWDMAGTELPPGVETGSVDIILMIFVFSAISPDQWAQAVSNVHTLLKPGGEILFRDYGRGDLAQVRFKKDRYLDENFYVRGDGTRVYFFAEQELKEIWTTGARAVGESKDCTNVSNHTKPDNVFDIVNLAVDRRMLVNRQRKLKMYRNWLQGRFRKPLPKGESNVPTQM